MNQKQSLKSAIVADRIKSAEVRDVRFEIDGIPSTDWRYDTKDPALWSWTGAVVVDSRCGRGQSLWSWTGAAEDEDPEPGEIAYDVAVWTVTQCKSDGLTHRETAKYIPFGKPWVGDRWPEIQDGEHDEALDRVEAITR